VTEFDRLFYIFKNSDGFQRIPEWIKEAGGISRRLAEACEVAAFDKEKKLKYEIDKMNEWDIQAQKEYAVRKGLEEGLQKGLQKGLREGREEGLEQGREETRLSIARKLFEAGTPVDVIVNCTGVDDGTIASFAHPE
jgi:predicted transposase/invertase (TIGR01784 family)